MREGTYGCGLKRTARVCSTSTTNTPRQIPVPNGDTAQGVCDMGGNVSEWTLDVYSPNYQESFADARPFLGGTTLDSIFSQRISDLMVTRGGAWSQREFSLRVTSRTRVDRNIQNINVGIRLVSSSCGNGILEPALGEVCDDGNHDAFDGCNFLCQEGDL